MFTWLKKEGHRLPFVGKKSSLLQKQSPEIKVAILTYYAKKQLNPSYNENDERDTYAYDCFNSLKGSSKDIVQAKEQYVISLIVSVVKNRPLKYLFSPYGGPAFWEICNSWIRRKVKMYASKESIDFVELKAELQRDFADTIQTAKKMGKFEEDAKEYTSFANAYWQKLHPAKE